MSSRSRIRTRCSTLALLAVAMILSTVAKGQKKPTQHVLQVRARQLDASPFPSLPEIPNLLSGTRETPAPPPTPTPPAPLVETWLPQNKYMYPGENYKLLAHPGGYGGVETKVDYDVSMTGEKYLQSAGLLKNISSVPPIPLPVLSGGDTGNTSDIASENCSPSPDVVTYDAGPVASVASRTVCQLITCFASDGSCGSCSGSFVADPTWSRRMLFLTSTHCVARNETDTIDMRRSVITCNRAAGATDGLFRPVAVAISRIDFSRGFGVSDGAVMLVEGLSDTKLAYAQQQTLAVAAVTPVGLAAQNIPLYTGGVTAFSQDRDQQEEKNGGPVHQGVCTGADALGNQGAIHYARFRANLLSLKQGLALEKKHFRCGGSSSGDVLFDEEHGVLFGVLSVVGGSSCTLSSSSSASNNNVVNVYSPIIAGAAGQGIPFLALVLALSPGHVVFRN